MSGPNSTLKEEKSEAMPTGPVSSLQGDSKSSDAVKDKVSELADIIVEAFSTRGIDIKKDGSEMLKVIEHVKAEAPLEVARSKVDGPEMLSYIDAARNVLIRFFSRFKNVAAL